MVGSLPPHASWEPLLARAWDALSPTYQSFLTHNAAYFPRNYLTAFTLPKAKTKAILFGQDPYPRQESAIGVAFIDGAVKELFSATGFSKAVNRATSLRNFLKMQLILEGRLDAADLSQPAIAKANKAGLVDSMDALRANFEREGILLLNTALIFTCKEETKKHAKAFMPFMQTLLKAIANEERELILFGNLAKGVELLLPAQHRFSLIHTPHPYNLGFIHDAKAQAYFKDKHLVRV
jgi:uracil-DNA glycosylase